MYLTRLALDPRSALARRDLGDPYEMHRTLTRAFIANETNKPSRFLWRLEAQGHAWADPVVLVQSEAAPVWGELQALPNYLKKSAETKSLSAANLVALGKSYRFRLLANPTVTRAGKRYGLAAEAEQLAWLVRQGERYGFVVENAFVSSSDVLKSRKDNMRINVQRAVFDGILRVHKPALLAGALTNGIGPAKAFGCGLLSIAGA